MRFLMKDNKFEYWKAKLLNHIDGLIKKEEKTVKKSFSDYVDYILKSAGRGHLVPKKITATNPKTGKTYTTTVYVNPNKKDGKKIYHSDSKGARISLGKLKKRLEKCTNSKELMQLVLENRDRFSDENGKPLPMIQEFSKYVSKLNDDIEAKENKKNIDSEIKNKLAAYMEKYPATFGKYSVNIENGKVSLEKDGKKYSRSFRYRDGAKDGNGYDWNEGALENLVVYARQEDKEAEEKENQSYNKLDSLLEKLKKSMTEEETKWCEDAKLKCKETSHTYTSKITGKVYSGNFYEADIRTNKSALASERNIAAILASKGFEVYLLEEDNTIPGKKVDALVNGVPVDFKYIEDSKNGIRNGYHDGMKKEHSMGIIFRKPSDLTNSDFSNDRSKLDKLSHKGLLSVFVETKDDFVNIELTDDLDTNIETIKNMGWEITPQSTSISIGAESENVNKDSEKQTSIERMNGIIDAKAKEYASDSYTKYAAEDRVKRLGKAKLEQYASLKLKSDEEFLQSLKEKVAGLDEEVSEYTLATAVWNHYVKKYARDWAQNKLKSMEQNESSITEPIEEKDMNEAVDIIGSDVRRILDGRDTYGNAKQGLVDKIKRRIRNNPGVARAMLTYIKQEQEKSGKTVFTAKHSIWEELPKLNEAARKAHESGESETKTGVTGSLYEGEDGTTIVENKDWGRYQISFPGKPDSETISTLKHNGFRWSPKTQTWVGYNTSNGEYSMKRVAEKLGLKKTEGIQKSFFGDIESSMPYSDEIDDEAETDGEEETFESVAKKNRQALEDWKKQQDIQKSVTDILNNL